MTATANIYPGFWPTAKLSRAMYSAAEGYVGKNDNVARMFRAVATRLHRYDQWEQQMETEKIDNKLVVPSDFGTGERMMKWLSFEHLPAELQPCVKAYNTLGILLCNNVPAGPERTVALRKLVESKDCAVRAVIEGMEAQKKNG